MTTATRIPRPQTRSDRPRFADLARNATAGIVLWCAYAAVRSITAGDLVSATQNAVTLMDLQRSVGLPDEADLQRAALEHPWLLRGANAYYLAVHFPATVAFLAWAWLRHRHRFSRIRNALVATTSVGLVLHVVYPLKPPRMMRGFVDTAAVFGPDPYELGISSGANQLAAMPSLHVGWALLVAIGVIATGSSPRRWMIVLHPITTVAVVVITANHYWTDAIVAAAIVAAAWILSRATARTTSLQAPGLGRRSSERTRTPRLRIAS